MEFDMELDNIRHEIVMVKGGLDGLVELLEKDESNNLICIIESLSMRLTSPINSLEFYSSIASNIPGVERAEQLKLHPEIS